MKPYVKILAGDNRINLGGYGDAHFTDIAFGAGLDWRLSPRWTLRAFDYVYQYLPGYFNSSLNPMGLSRGLATASFEDPLHKIMFLKGTDVSV